MHTECYEQLQIRNMVRRIYITAVFLITSLAAFSQPKELLEVYELFSTGDVASARTKIDSAINNEELAGMSMSWYLRGFIYKDLFKIEKSPDLKEELRKTSATSLTKALSLPGADEYRENCMAAIRYIGTSYYNDAIISIQKDGHKDAVQYYDEFKKHTLIADPDFEFLSRDVMFYNGMGGLYSDLFERNREENKEYFEKSLEYYEIVLNLDSLDWNANYNSGILFYNEGVHIINASDEEPDFTSLMEIQDQSRDLFKKALPFMLRAYRLDPEREDALHALSGIYFSLHDLEKSEYYKGLLKKE